MTGKRTRKRKTTSPLQQGRKTGASKLDKAVASNIGPLLNGTILAIDPSSGSANSQPGYALFKSGQLEDSGLVRIRSGDEVHNRLYRLSHSLREDFEQPDLLVTENIPPFMGEGPGAAFATRNVISLHQSVGVIMSIWDVPVLLVSPRSWRSLVPDNYHKSDENDAIMLGWTAIHKALLANSLEFREFDERLLHKLTTGVWP